jgi:hypothetical protein
MNHDIYCNTSQPTLLIQTETTALVLLFGKEFDHSFAGSSPDEGTVPMQCGTSLSKVFTRMGSGQPSLSSLRGRWIGTSRGWGTKIPATAGVTVLASLAAWGAVHAGTTVAFTCSLHIYGLKNSITVPYLLSRRSPLLPMCQSMKFVVCLLWFSTNLRNIKQSVVNLVFNTRRNYRTWLLVEQHML